MVNPPTNLKCSISEDLLKATWTGSTSSGITEYRIRIYNGTTMEKEIFVPGSQRDIIYSISSVSGSYSIHLRALVTRTNYSSAVVSLCTTGGLCSGAPGPVTGLTCSKSGSAISVSWSPPASGTYDKFRIHYYTGTTYVERFTTGTSDSYTSDTVDSVHVRAVCGTSVSSSVVGSCGTGGCTIPICNLIVS